jgi:hypothetical protein
MAPPDVSPEGAAQTLVVALDQPEVTTQVALETRRDAAEVDIEGDRRGLLAAQRGQKALSR